MKISQIPLGLVFVLALGARCSAAPDKVQMIIPPGDYPKEIGSKSLQDPLAGVHNKQVIKGKVLVAIFSVPNMSQGDTQEKWAKILADDPATKVSGKVALYLIEDMSQAGWTKGMARSSMKSAFTKGARPVLILDEEGGFTQRFGIPKNTTCILIYDKKAKLRDVELNLEDVDTTSSRVKTISNQLLSQ